VQRFNRRLKGLIGVSIIGFILLFYFIMFSLLLEKFDKIKKQRDLYCLQFEKMHANDNNNNKNAITLYDFICKNRRA
jgi:hypothetical protein